MKIFLTDRDGYRDDEYVELRDRFNSEEDYNCKDTLNKLWDLANGDRFLLLTPAEYDGSVDEDTDFVMYFQCGYD